MNIHHNIYNYRLTIRLWACLVGITMLISACAPKQEEISLYVALEVEDYLHYIVNQYNLSQDNYFVKIRPIDYINLKDVLLNNMNRENLFLLVTKSTIIDKAGSNYLEQLFPLYNSEARVIYFNSFSQRIIRDIDNYGVPLYIYDFASPGGVSVATLGVPRTGYSIEHVFAMQSFLEFLSKPETNVQALMYNHVPVYSDALYSLLTNNQRRRVSSGLPRNDLTYELQPLESGFTVAP